jgi:predicted ester cyclase
MTNTIFDRWFEELWNRGRIEIIDAMLSPDCVTYRLDETGGNANSTEAFKAFFRRFRSAFPDIKITLEDAIEAAGWAAARFVFEGTHSAIRRGSPRPAARFG